MTRPPGQDIARRAGVTGPGARRRSMAVVVALAVAWMFASCSESGSSAAAPANGTRVECGPVPRSAQDAVAALLRARVTGQTGVEVAIVDGRAVVTYPTPVSAADAASLCRAPKLELRPVLDTHPSQPVEQDVPPDRSGVFAASSGDPLNLSVAVLSHGRAASTASASGSFNGMWSVQVMPRDEVARGLNDLASHCYQRDGLCPLGMMAIVYDQRVLFAGTVQAPAFDAGFQIPADGRERASQIAAILAEGVDAGLGVVSLR